MFWSILGLNEKVGVFVFEILSSVDARFYCRPCGVLVAAILELSEAVGFSDDVGQVALLARWARRGTGAGIAMLTRRTRRDVGGSVFLDHIVGFVWGWAR